MSALLGACLGPTTEEAAVARSIPPSHSGFLLVGVTGFEPATSSSRTTRATKLRHTPKALTRSGPSGSLAQAEALSHSTMDAASAR